MALIGIGYTTYRRPDLMQQAYESLLKHTFDVTTEYVDGGVNTTLIPKDNNEYLIYIAEDTDTDRKGVAARKNECLRALKDCDYVFLFDDDCFPIKDGWADLFVYFHKMGGVNHLLYLKDEHKKVSEINCGFVFDGICKIDIYQDCGGVFMFLSKDAIKKVGAFDEKFTPYGFEHCDYSRRILGNHGKYPCLAETDKYIFAHDYSTPGHKSSITDEEKSIHVKNNWDKYFNNKNESIYLPL